ncbi:MAG: MFS transporter [Pseudomonadota bacterium]
MDTARGDPARERVSGSAPVNSDAPAVHDAPQDHDTPAPGGAPPPRMRPWAFTILLGGVFCMGLGQTVVFAVLPAVGRTLGFADFQVASIFMLSAVFWITMGPRWGRLSDAYGRRLFIILGIAGFVASMLLFTGAIQLGLSGVLNGVALYLIVLAMRCLYGLLGSAQPPAAQAYIADRTRAEERAKGLAAFAAAFGAGSTLGPAFAGLLSPYGLLAPLFGVAALGAFAGLLVFFLLPENTAPKERRASPRLSLTDGRFKTFLAIGLCGGAIGAIPIQMMAFFLIDVLALETTAALPKVSVALTAAAGAGLFAQLVLVGALSMTPRQLIRAAPIALALGHAGFVFFSSFPMLVVAAGVAGLGWGMLGPGYTAAVSLSVTPSEQGAASGLSNAAGASGFILAPPIGFFLYAFDPRAPFVMTSICAALLALFVWRSRRVAMVR